MSIIHNRARRPEENRFHQIMVRMNDRERDALNFLVAYYNESSERSCSMAFVIRRSIWNEFASVVERKRLAGVLPENIWEVK